MSAAVIRWLRAIRIVDALTLGTLLLTPCAAAPLPAEWSEGASRFERFLAEREKVNLDSDLCISPQGEVSNDIPVEEARIVLFRRGSQVFQGTLENVLRDHASEILFPGRYAACMRTGTGPGSQFVPPLVWFDVKETEERTAAPSIPPEPAEKFWPNPRLLAFLDYNSLPRRSPLAISSTNNRAKPNVILTVKQDGTVERNTLAPAFEETLKWRVFHDGVLISEESATGDDRLPPLTEPGSYLVLAGVEGPEGFFPVSNFLQFPLFPDGGKLVVVPSKDSQGVPKFLYDVLPASDLINTLEASAGEYDRNKESSYYNPRFVYFPRRFGSFPDDGKRTLYELWRAWAWNVQAAISPLADPISRINLATPSTSDPE